MPMQCNIDAKGKLARLIYGVVLMLIGLVLLFTWTIPTGGLVAWLATVFVVLSGAFAIFEARAGWCIVRAMGFKTPF